MEPLDSVDATEAGRPATTTTAPRGGQRGNRLFLVLITIYAGGLIFWLVLGLLPTLADVFAPVRHWALSVAESSSVFAGPAARILDANQSMPGMAMEATRPGSVALQYGFSALNLALGVILIVRRANDLVPRLLALALLGTAATFNKPSHAVFHILGEPWPIKTVHFTFHIVSGVAYLWAVLLFPDGRLPRRLHLEGRQLAVVAGAVTLVVTMVSWRSSFVNHPQFFVVFFGVVVSLFGLGSQAMKVSDPHAGGTEWRASRLLAAALLPAFAAGVAWLAGRAIILVGGSAAPRGEHLDNVIQGVFPAVFAVVPVVLFAGILRYRLWNLDWFLSRALVYGLLGAVVALAYVGAVSAFDLVVGSTAWTTVLVLSVVAVGIEPLRRVARRWSNRVVYGQVLSPTDAVRTMLTGLEGVDSGSELQQLTRVVVDATRVRRCELWVDTGPEAVQAAATADETVSGSTKVAFPVTYKDRLVGDLRMELNPGESLGPDELELIDSLASHAGVVVHNAGLNTELARHIAILAEQVEELRSSRRRLVTAQDLERRKLERDLHDGAQQSLVAALISLRSLARSARDEPIRSERAHVARIVDGASGMLGELVSDEGPRVLIDLGLIGALEAAGSLAARSGFHVSVDGAVTGEIASDASVAVYFCCLEALQNATKHSGASEVAVTISQLDDLLEFTVSDNGRGFDPSAQGFGSGMGNLVNRMSVLGGDVTVESAPGQGTSVHGWLPVGVGMVSA